MPHPIAEDLIAHVLHRDSNIIVLNKPPGLASHGGPKTYFHVDAYLPDLKFGIQPEPTLAHRLVAIRQGAFCCAGIRNRQKRSPACLPKRKSARPIGRWFVVR